MRIGKELRNIRCAKHMSKVELCRRTGLNKGYVYRLENDLISPTLTTLEKVSNALAEPLWLILQQADSLDSSISYASKHLKDADWDHTAEPDSKINPTPK